MVQSKQSVKSLVIQGYLNGKTRDQIALDVGISGDKVSEIIKEWITEIGKPNVEDLRDFAVSVRKSGINIKEFAEGNRIKQLLEKVGVNGGTEGYGSNGNNNDSDANKEIILFLQEIYLFCKKFGISPATVFSWIRDLQGFFGHSHNNNNHCDYLESVNEGYEQDNNIEDERYGYQQQWPGTKPNMKNPPMENGILFISQVPRLIDQRKKEYRMLKGDKQQTIKEIDELEKKRDQAERNLNNILQKEKSAVVYLKWYYSLKKVLWVYGISIEEIRDFAKVMHDFKTLGFDAAKIYNEYHNALSLRQETRDNERKNKQLYDQGAVLHSKVSSLQTQLGMHSQTLKAFSELEAMGFGLKEIKQLRLTVLEIADANHVPVDQAVSKFLKDVDEQYDMKLGFEKEAI